jgi:hypothetical protein
MTLRERIRTRSPVRPVFLATVFVASAAAVTALVVAGSGSTADPPPRIGKACAGPGAVEVRDAVGLTHALATVTPGAVIRLAPGLYPGRFVATARGTPEQPIVLCGGRDAVLDGGDVEVDGYTVHLAGAQHWQLSGFTVRGGQKGVMADGARMTLMEGLLVEGTGDEAVHLRRTSTDNVVRGNVIRRTGLREAQFGEGVYVGTAESNWCRESACAPDRSDRNVIEGNDISETTAESVDIKEGTSSGVLRDNTFSGSAMTEADSWVDVKGNDWVIVGNTGTDSPQDGFQVHEILDGWGVGNFFGANVSDVDADGYAINITKNRDRNRVGCDNRSRGAGKGLSTVDCV